VVLVLILLALTAGASATTYVAASMTVYRRVRALGKRPIFSMLSVPGYLVTFCRRERCDSSSGIAGLLRIIRVTQVVMLVAALAFVILMSGSSH
jgi:hypothetical protein